MMHKRNSYLFLVVAFFAFCTPRTGLKDVTAKEQTPIVPIQPQTTTTQVYKEPETKAKFTYIDTLNDGQEISLVKSTAPKSSDVANSHYFIQILASSQIEAVRAKKKEMESNTKLNLNIVFESPFYKLYAGDFVKRTDAESELTRIKKLGVSDAWIVTISK
jgi:hypothetical protein